MKKRPGSAGSERSRAAMLGGWGWRWPAASPDIGFAASAGKAPSALGDRDGGSGDRRSGAPAVPGYQPVSRGAYRLGRGPAGLPGRSPPRDDIPSASPPRRASTDVQYRVGRVNSDQYGFKGGYTSIEGVHPIFRPTVRTCGSSTPRRNITDYSQGAANLGLGYRRYILTPWTKSSERRSGTSTTTATGRDYSQAGLSLENIGRYFSTRFNTNIPL